MSKCLNLFQDQSNLETKESYRLNVMKVGNKDQILSKASCSPFAILCNLTHYFLQKYSDGLSMGWTFPLQSEQQEKIKKVLCTKQALKIKLQCYAFHIYWSRNLSF